MKKFYSLLLLFVAGSILASAVGTGQRLSLAPEALKNAVNLEERIKGMVKKAPASRADENEEQWNLVGTGKYTDDIMTSAELDSETWEVEIYESITTPGFYRVENPYGNGKCPYFDTPFDGGDFLLHAENPEAVWMEYVELKGVDFGLMDDEYCPAYITDYVGYYVAAGYFTPEQAIGMNMASGKMLGGNITFEAESLFLDFPLFNDGLEIPANLSGLFCVSLPGASDYSFSIDYRDICTDSTLSFAYKAGADIGEVKFALYSGMLSFETKDEELFEKVVAEGKTAADGVVTVAPEYGINTLAVAAMTKDGDVIAKEVIYCFGQQENAEEWKTIGKAEYSEDVLASIWPDDVSNVVYEVDVQESTTTPGRYRLVDLYGPAYPHYESLADDGNIPEGHNHHHYVVIDTTNPEMVTIEASPICIEIDAKQMILFSEGWHSMQLGANLNDPEVLEGFGKIENGKITFLGGAIYLYMPGEALYRGNIKHKFYIQLPETDSVADVIAADDEGETVYYNLSGLPVATPSVSGVYVKVKNGHAEKVYVK